VIALEPGLHIMNYLGVSFEASELIRGIGWYHSPDVLEAHLAFYAAHAHLISLSDGLARLRSGPEFDRPHVALWFDDGFRGVREQALPILESYGITAGTSVCSRFARREEMYWVCMLSALAACDGLPIVRSRLHRQFGYPRWTPLKEWIHLNFSLPVVSVIKDVWLECTTEAYRESAADLFDDERGLRELVAAGWLVANHTAAHYPAGRRSPAALVIDQFVEGAEFVRSLSPGAAPYLVAPFGCVGRQGAPVEFLSSLGLDGTIVCVGNRRNTVATFREAPVIHRTSPEWEFAKSWSIRG
jgi:peptidoglycan/xylan/chitin deacetylase (PgdA/CDA1 family)